MLFRSVLHFLYNSSGLVYKARGPTTFNSLPIVSADSTLRVRVRRDDVTKKIWLGLFKTARADGMNPSKTIGVIVDMVEIDATASSVYFPAAGTPVQIYLTLVLTKGKPY